MAGPQPPQEWAGLPGAPTLLPQAGLLRIFPLLSPQPLPTQGPWLILEL